MTGRAFCQAQILLGVLYSFKIPGHILPAIPKGGMRDAHGTGVPDGYGKGERKPYRIWNLEFPRKEWKQIGRKQR